MDLYNTSSILRHLSSSSDDTVDCRMHRQNRVLSELLCTTFAPSSPHKNCWRGRSGMLFMEVIDVCKSAHSYAAYTLIKRRHV